MKTYLSIIQIFLLFCLLLGCRQDGSDKPNDIAVIDVINNLGNYQEIPVSELVSELEYIPLEINDNCLIGAVRSMLVTPSHIFIQSYVGSGDMIMSNATRLYAFNRDGRFICEIGRVGQGPGEYQNMQGFSVDEKKQLVYIETWFSLLEYSFDGGFRRSINKPPNTQNMNGRMIDNVRFVRDDIFIGYWPTINRSYIEAGKTGTGNERYTYHLFNSSGQMVKSFENSEKHERGDNYQAGMYENMSMKPFRVSDYIYVKELPNDTLYCLNEQDELIPQFVFDLGKYTYSFEKRGRVAVYPHIPDMKDVLIIPFDATYPMVGTPNYIFFNVSGKDANAMKSNGIINRYSNGMEGEMKSPFGFYDIANKRTRLLDTDPVSRMNGLINDMDGGLSFWPKCYSSGNELADVWQAYEMKEILTEKYFAGHTIKNPQSHQKLKELLNNLDWEDNPVIVIAKLKK